VVDYKFNLSPLTVAKQASPWLSTVAEKHDDCTDEKENILTVWIYEQFGTMYP
jgi:hypothetical protein